MLCSVSYCSNLKRVNPDPQIGIFCNFFPLISKVAFIAVTFNENLAYATP